jgi:hypothetical protein
VALFLVAFIESSVFPIPPDVLLIPMVLARRAAWLRYALICTVASIAGASAPSGGHEQAPVPVVQSAHRYAPAPVINP